MKLHRAVRFLAFALLLLAIPAALSSTSSAQIGIGIGISVQIGPPALPVYEQPICPSPGFLWAPGYWAWSDDAGYYWVPGTWVEPPTVGLLWTPGYWGWNNGAYVWNGGYWGPQIGFYGGINYGFGYGGVGFVGGEWRGGAFFYNTAVMHVDTVSITNVYVNRTVIVNNDSHVAFNGGEGGVAVRPTPQQEAYARQPHTPPVASQVQQEHAASQNRALFASENHGAPAVAATARPGEFSGKGVVGGQGCRSALSCSCHVAQGSARRGPGREAPATPNRPEPASRPSTPPPSTHAATPPREQNARPATEPRTENAPHPATKENAPKESAPKAKPPKEKAPPKREEEKEPKGL
jgi:hypothetical protein